MSFFSLVDILKRVQHRYPGFAKRMEEAEALGRWEIAVGPGIAKHARAIKVQDSILWIEVDHAVWRSELHHRKRQILDLLNQDNKEKKNQEIITDLFFVDKRAQRY